MSARVGAVPPIALASAAALTILLGAASCASFVPPSDRETPEIDDLSAYATARAHRGAAASSAVLLPEPPLADPGLAARPQPGTSTGGAATHELALPPAPAPLLLVDIVRPEAEATRAALPMPLPAVPAAAPKPAAATAAARPAATKAAPTASASAAAPAPSAAAAAGASSPAASAAAAPAVREVYARVGDELDIDLAGVGYLFLGLPDTQAGGMSFKTRTIRNGRTYFTFTALKLGTYDLDFQRQDNSSGSTVIESVRVSVLTEPQFAEAVARQAAGLSSPSGTSALEAERGDTAFAERLVAMGKETAAIGELLKGYQEGEPSLDDRIATLYAGGGDLDAAEKYWRKNVDRADPWSSRAVVGLARIAVARRDVSEWLAIHRRLLAVTGLPISDVLVDAAVMARELGEVGLGLDLLGEYARRYPTGSRMDEAAWHSAQLLEQDTQFRDLKRARELYAALLRDYPESPLAGGARERIRWLDQHVFLVR